MNKIPRWSIILFLVIVAGVVLRLTVFRPKPITVQVARIGRGLVEETVTNTRSGTIKARERSKLSPQVGGRVVALPYPKGARVPKGALLLKLDDSVQRAQLQLALDKLKTAGAKVREAEASADLAAKNYSRSVELAKEGITSAQFLDTLNSRRLQTMAAAKAAHAILDQARSGVALAKAELALTEVRAPFAGILANRTTEVGEWITPAPPGIPIPPVLDLLSPESLYVSAPIDEVDSVRVHTGQRVRITVDSVPGGHFFGKVSRVAPYVNDIRDQDRTVEVEATFDDPKRAAMILPGTSADIEIVLSQRKDVLRIPTAAIAEGGKVLVVKRNRLVEKTIKTGLKNWRYAQVLRGLKTGELVVTARDSTAVKAGARVSPQIETP